MTHECGNRAEGFDSPPVHVCTTDSHEEMPMIDPMDRTHFSYKIQEALEWARERGVVHGCPEELEIKPFTFRLLEGRWRIFYEPAWTPPRKDDPELCPNGQGRRECTEIDPCESCYQDDQEEGDMIERSMGLREN
jgi:hypothetical protein